LPATTDACSYGITDLRTKSQIYPQVIDVCSGNGKLVGKDVSTANRQVSQGTLMKHHEALSMSTLGADDSKELVCWLG
jgi:hypothetical protein